MKNVFLFIFILFLGCVATYSVHAQTTEFTYQGRLLFSGTPANGSHDFEFRLFADPDGSEQVGPAVPLGAVNVNNGVFSVRLDFGNQFSGANRFLEIRVRATGEELFSVLTPRQSITSAPYAIKSLNAENAASSENSSQLGGVSADQFVHTGDARLSDARNPLPNSTNYIQNTISPQSANFSISGTGRVTGLRVESSVGNVVIGNPGCLAGFAGLGFAVTLSNCSNYSLLGNGTDTMLNRVMGGRMFFREGNVDQMVIAPGGNIGIGATAPAEKLHVSGNTLITGNLSVNGTLTVPSFSISGGGSFGGTLAANIFNSSTDFRIGSARVLGIAGTDNLFVGSGSGAFNSAGARNTFVGSSAGTGNSTGTDNSFFGASAGFVNNGGHNSFLGANAGSQNSMGGKNSFFGSLAGSANTDGNDNSFVGFRSGMKTTTGFNNAFLGSQSGQENTTGANNSFFDYTAGINNTTGFRNSTFGSLAGFFTTTGDSNSFYGFEAGQVNTTGRSNSLFGAEADVGVGNLTNATAIGAKSLVSASNSLVLGSVNGVNGATADTNVGIGTTSPSQRLHIRVNGGNILFGGAGCNSGFAGIGFGNTLNGCSTYSVLGNGTDTILNRPAGGSLFVRQGNTNEIVVMPEGRVGIGTTSPEARLHVNGKIIAPAIEVPVTNSGVTTPNLLFNRQITYASGESLCATPFNGTFSLVSFCTFQSPRRYKTEIVPLAAGLDLIKSLRPVSFSWKATGKRDYGLIAEEVAEVEPLMVVYNTESEVEGLRYEKLGILLVNAVKEQQSQIEAQREQIDEQKESIRRQQTEIDALRKYICLQDAAPEFCRPRD